MEGPRPGIESELQLRPHWSFFFFFFGLFRAVLAACGIPRLGVELELQLPA